MIIAINYADDNYKLQQEYNTQTAWKKGKVDCVIEYHPKDIDSAFLDKNKHIFAYKRGAGLWLWKPYIILKTLQQMNDGDYLFYCDSGAYYTKPIRKLVSVLERDGIEIMPFELPLLECQWTKRETFVEMGCDNNQTNQILATFLLLKKSPLAMKIVNEWLYYSQNEICISPKLFTDIKNPNDFIAHREDQSIFSLLCRKNGIIPYREPSQYGDRPYIYAWTPRSGMKEYSLHYRKYPRSTYPRIVVSVRKSNPKEYRWKNFIKDIFDYVGLYRLIFKYKTQAKI